MFKFDLTNEDINKVIDSSYGPAYNLEPGWYVLRINEISQPVVKENGDANGYILLEDVDSGVSFRSFVTYQVMEDKKKWMVKQTIDFILRLCQVTGTDKNNWKSLVGKTIYANVEQRKSKGKSTETDQFGAPLVKEYINNDVIKVKMCENILEVPKQAEVKNDSFDFDFNGFNG